MTIDYLNSIVKLKLAPSKIHGVGVFATKDIGAGTKLYADAMPFPYKVSPGNQKKLLGHVRETIAEQWPKMVAGVPFAYPSCIFQAYMNHSDDPNYDSNLDLTTRDIRAGEEITEDYRRIEGYTEIYTWLA